MNVRTATSAFDRPAATKLSSTETEVIEGLFNKAEEVIRTTPGPKSKSGRGYLKATFVLSDGRQVYVSLDAENQAIRALLAAGFSREQAERMIEAAK